uniref:THAP-type domain-containing protein n=1 Tax=Sinocyclocheilus anshuiensis TaxID=1608454 RepID=A0A671LYR6_9TELE
LPDFHRLPSDPSIRKEWMNFIFNEVPDHVSKNLVLCSLHFTADSFTNKAQFDAEFSERLKLKDDAVPTILDPTVMSHHVSNCFYNVFTIALSVITDLHGIRKKQKHSKMHCPCFSVDR